MTATDLRSRDRYLRQEAEANQFAIELLTPRKRLRRYLVDDPDLHQVLAIAEEFQISREAAARRYVSLHHAGIAVVFSKNGAFQYAERAQAFPSLSFSRGARVPLLHQNSAATGLSYPEEHPRIID